MTRSRMLAALMLAVVALMLSTPRAVAQTQTSAPKPAATAKTALLDINVASKRELAALTGIGDDLSQKIIDGRPYTRKNQLVSKKILSQAAYDKIKGQIIAKQTKKK